MRWSYSFEEHALKELKKLGPRAHKEILTYLDERIATDEDPSRFGKPLRGDLARIVALSSWRLSSDLRSAGRADACAGAESRTPAGCLLLKGERPNY